MQYKQDRLENLISTYPVSTFNQSSQWVPFTFTTLLQLTQLPSNTTNAEIDTRMPPALTLFMPPFTPHTDRFTIYNMYKYMPTYQDSWMPFAILSTPGKFAVAQLLLHGTSEQ